MSEPEVRVSYGVKELLGRIDTRLESIDSKLDAKADLRLVLDMQDRLAKMEKQWEERLAVEADMAHRNSQAFSKREKLVGLVIAAFAVLIQPLQQHFHL